MFGIQPVQATDLLKVQPVEAAETPIVVVTSLSSREDFERYIDEEAPKYGLSPAKVKAVVSCETGDTWDPTIQSGYYRNGVRERSFGLAQINEPEHKGMTVAEAQTPKIALDYLMQNWYTDTWTCQHGSK